MKKGGISVQTENIFPVIKKWLYSDKDIFIRELVSNACDAITKHKRLVSLSEADESNDTYRITVSVNKANKTLTVTDNGIGMTEEEVDKYINSIALSGALEFIAKYEGEGSVGGGIIGHFGLGFYSAFMVARHVEINTRSYTDAPAVHWDCNDGGEYELGSSDKKDRGSEICLHIADDQLEYLDYSLIKGIMDKYCSFMPYEIYCTDGEKEDRINPTVPAWQKNPSEVTDEEYNDLYKKMFSDFRDPLLCVHINADYPLNFKGVLYFPAQKNSLEPKEGVIKLFYNSVFVADNIKEIVPDYLSGLCGALDCPELPLNVSRSYLQDDAYVRKLSAHIVKKIADKLCKLKNDDMDKYSPLWDSIRPYMEYGCIRDAKFFDRIKSALLFKRTDGIYDSYEDVVGVTEGDGERRIYYTTDPVRQSYYVSMFAEKGFKVYVLDTVIDTQFASFLEDKNNKIKFYRVDASLEDVGSDAEKDEKLAELFEKATGKNKEKIRFCSMGENGAVALIQLSEDNRRFADMMRMYAMVNGEGDSTPVDEELVINRDSKATAKLGTVDEDKALIVAKHIYYTALIANRPLGKEELGEFLDNEKNFYGLI